MNVVVDCNVLVSASRVDGVCRKVIGNVVRWHNIVLSDPILAEYEAVAERPKHAPYRDSLRAVIAEFRRVAFFVKPTEVTFGLGDPDDEVYLATAASGAAILITGNSRDFTRPRYGSVKVLSPRVFLDKVT